MGLQRDCCRSWTASVNSSPAREVIDMPKRGFIPNKLRPWIDARKRFHLSHAQIQMARELGMNPKKFGRLANHKQEPWKAPLAEYIEHLYQKKFGKRRPDDVRSIEVKDAEKRKRKALKKEQKKAIEIS